MRASDYHALRALIQCPQGLVGSNPGDRIRSTVSKIVIFDIGSRIEYDNTQLPTWHNLVLRQTRMTKTEVFETFGLRPKDLIPQGIHRAPFTKRRIKTHKFDISRKITISYS